MKKEWAPKCRHGRSLTPADRNFLELVNVADPGERSVTMLATTKYGFNPFGSLVRFGLLALVPVVALGAVLAHELNVDVQQRYLETARRSATLITQVGIQPLLSAEQVAGGLKPAEVSLIDEKLQGAAVSQEVRRLKVWNRSGTIVYSDNNALVGKTFPIDTDLGEALEGRSSASIRPTRLQRDIFGQRRVRALSPLCARPSGDRPRVKPALRRPGRRSRAFLRGHVSGRISRGPMEATPPS